MKNYILSGYIYGVIWGLSYGWFRMNHPEDEPWALTIFGPLIGAFLIWGPLAAFGGYIGGLMVEWDRKRLARKRLPEEPTARQ